MFGSSGSRYTGVRSSNTAFPGIVGAGKACADAPCCARVFRPSDAVPGSGAQKNHALPRRRAARLKRHQMCLLPSDARTWSFANHAYALVRPNSSSTNIFTLTATSSSRLRTRSGPTSVHGADILCYLSRRGSNALQCAAVSSRGTLCSAPSVLRGIQR